MTVYIFQAPCLYSEIRNYVMMAHNPSLVLKNVSLPSGRVADISVSGGSVTHVGSAKTSDTTIDCTGFLVLPGAIDMHVHMRGGMQSEKEDWQSGSRSALAGGVTVVVDQPNTIPPITTESVFLNRLKDAQEHSLCHFAINSGAAANTPFESMWQIGAAAFGEIFFAPSSYGEAIGEDTLRQVFEKIGALRALATIHAERISPLPDRDLSAHDTSRSSEGEAAAVCAVNRCNQSRCRVHFCHLSSAPSLDAAAGSVEVAPHHLFLSRETFENDNAFMKVNPPLRTERERRALWERWDRIDVIASDHAPHTVEEKNATFIDAPAGIPGVETMMPLLVTKVLEHTISVQSLIKKTTTNPAALLAIPEAGFNVGNRADFAVYPKTPIRITSDTLHSKCGWTPFENLNATFPVIVVMNGSIVFRDGEYMKGSPQWFPGHGYRKPG
jgi:dihydroorotase